MSNTEITPIKAHISKEYDPVYMYQALAEHRFQYNPENESDNLPVTVAIEAEGDLILIFRGYGNDSGHEGTVRILGLEGIPDAVFSAPDTYYRAVMVEQKSHKHMNGEYRGKVLVSVYDAELMAVDLP